MRKLTRHWRWAVPTVAAAAVGASMMVAFGPLATADSGDQSKGDEWNVVYGDADLGGSFTSVASADGKAWAFGAGPSENGDDGETRISTYDGEKWDSQTGPDGFAGSPEMPTASSAEDVWAKAQMDTLLLRFDGAEWTTVEPDLGKGSSVTTLEAVAKNDLWVVPNDGTTHEFRRFDGSSWSSVPAPEEATSGLGSLGSDEVYAAGRKGEEGNGVGLVNRWDGEQWKSMNFPEVELDKGCSGAGLETVEPLAQDDVWAAGEVECASENENEYSKPLVGHWDGEEWEYTVGDREMSGFSDIATDGDGGVWLSGNSALTRATADGKQQEYPVGDKGDAPDLSVANLEGTKMLGTASPYEDDYGAVLGYGG